LFGKYLIQILAPYLIITWKKDVSISIENEARWSPQTLGILWRRDIFLDPAGE
jgi:hypothetical protein